MLDDVRELLVWGSGDPPPEGHACVYTWNGYIEQRGVKSLLRYCESHAEELRSSYLAWIQDIGEIRIGQRTVVEHLAIEDGLSYWWMTLLVEKSPYKSSITDAIRLLALERIVREYKPAVLHLVGQSREICMAVQALCRSLKIGCRITAHPQPASRVVTTKKILRLLPQSIQGMLSFGRYLWSHRAFRKLRKPEWNGGVGSLFLCSYFFNMRLERAKPGDFYSDYWGGLHQLIRESDIRANWLHMYVPHPAVATPRSANALIRSFNREGESRNIHALLESYLTWPIVFRLVKRWVGLWFVLWRLRRLSSAFNPVQHKSFLWPLMKEDWISSLIGTFSINNLLSIGLFDAAMKDLPYQEKGLYLCENQSWERALIHAWKKHGHGQLIAVPHSTIRFWDLRYFSDLRAFQSSVSYPVPQPHLTALNGKAAINAYQATTSFKQSVVECEALRFSYLNRVRKEDISRKPSDIGIRVLILGEYSPPDTLRLMHLLELALSRVTAVIVCTIKPHPAYPVTAADYPALSLTVDTNSLENILHNFDLIYSGNRTSAAVDAYLAGIPVVVMLDDAELNFSPLRERPGVRFVSSADQLASELLAPGSYAELEQGERDDFFFLDPALPRWRRLLRA